MKGIAIGLSHTSKVILKRLKRTEFIDEIYLACSTYTEEIEKNEIILIKPKEVLKENWEDLALIIFIGSIGASVRLINSFLTIVRLFSTIHSKSILIKINFKY